VAEEKKMATGTGKEHVNAGSDGGSGSNA